MATLTLSTEHIESIVFDEALREGGLVVQSYRDDSRLYMRSVYPREQAISVGDKVQGGVAVRVSSPVVQVCAFVFRQVCANGAVAPMGESSDEIDLREIQTPHLQEERIRTVIRACGQAGVFDQNADRMRALTSMQMTRDVMFAMSLGRCPWLSPAQILDYLDREGCSSPSAYDYMNALTAIARETRDEERRWRLEEAGAAVMLLADEPQRLGKDALELPMFNHEDDWILMVR